MKKAIKVLTFVFAITIILTGCGKKEEIESSTPANLLTDSFTEIIKNEKDLSVVAKKLSENEIIQTKMMIEEKTNSDFLTGFKSEIKNFDKAYVIQPIINSIPFIMYVFESKNTALLEEELKENSDPRWNICVEADETNIKIVDNYVFFVMAPKSFE